MLVPDLSLGYRLQFPEPRQGDLGRVARRDLPPGHGTECSQVTLLNANEYWG